MYSITESFIIPASHPSLPGHFPGNPVVPGVVILDQVIRLWQQQTHKQVKTVLNTKFVSILKPEKQCTIEYQEKKYPKVEFLIYDNTREMIAKGLFSYVE